MRLWGRGTPRNACFKRLETNSRYSYELGVCVLICLQKARDLREEGRTPRYASSVPLIRAHGASSLEILQRNRDITTRMVATNGSNAEIGSDLNRTHLIDGRKLALLKIPIAAFGEKDDHDKICSERRKDFTVFGGKHEGSETRVFFPPSVGWERQVKLDTPQTQSHN
jgi:hypothetical protein